MHKIISTALAFALTGAMATGCSSSKSGQQPPADQAASKPAGGEHPSGGDHPKSGGGEHPSGGGEHPSGGADAGTQPK